MKAMVWFCLTAALMLAHYGIAQGQCFPTCTSKIEAEPRNPDLSANLKLYRAVPGCSCVVADSAPPGVACTQGYAYLWRIQKGEDVAAIEGANTEERCMVRVKQSGQYTLEVVITATCSAGEVTRTTRRISRLTVDAKINCDCAWIESSTIGKEPMANANPAQLKVYGTPACSNTPCDCQATKAGEAPTYTWSFKGDMITVNGLKVEATATIKPDTGGVATFESAMEHGSGLVTVVVKINCSPKPGANGLPSPGCPLMLVRRVEW